jgi:hypothetical protein
VWTRRGSECEDGYSEMGKVLETLIELLGYRARVRGVSAGGSREGIVTPEHTVRQLDDGPGYAAARRTAYVWCDRREL